MWEGFSYYLLGKKKYTLQLSKLYIDYYFCQEHGLLQVSIKVQIGCSFFSVQKISFNFLLSQTLKTK